LYELVPVGYGMGPVLIDVWGKQNDVVMDRYYLFWFSGILFTVFMGFYFVFWFWIVKGNWKLGFVKCCAAVNSGFFWR